MPETCETIPLYLGIPLTILLLMTVAFLGIMIHAIIKDRNNDD